MHCFRVLSVDEPARVRKGEMSCVVGRDVQVNTKALEDYCFQLLSEREYELGLLAGVVAFVDRSVRRQLSEGWPRHLKIIMPVQKVHEWINCGSALCEALRYLTGDSWEISFIAKKTPWFMPRQQFLINLGVGRFVVVPFSNGLDSFAQSQLLKVESPGVTPIRITASNKGLPGDRVWMQDSDGTKYRRVSIPIRISARDHPEQTYRARTFLFYVFAGIAAHLANAEAILIPENGQGAIGPSLVPFGAESPHRGSHPAFTWKLEKFLNLLFGKKVSYEHPQLWRTKGEVLNLLKKENLIAGWTSTKSCPRDSRDIYLNRKNVHCGVCSACLLRRMAAFAADLSEPDHSYLWPNLHAGRLADSIHPDSDRGTVSNDIDIATHGVMDMDELANQTALKQDDPRLQQCVFELSDRSSIKDVMPKLQRLIEAHKSEWLNFKNSFGPKSWLHSGDI